MVLKETQYGQIFFVWIQVVAMRIAIEMIEGLQYNLIMMGSPIEGPHKGFCDNSAIVTISQLSPVVHLNMLQ